MTTKGTYTYGTIFIVHGPALGFDGKWQVAESFKVDEE